MGYDNTHAALIEMAAEAAFKANAADRGVVVSVVYDGNAQDYNFVVWTLTDTGMQKHRLLASVTNQERLNAHVLGFVA